MRINFVIGRADLSGGLRVIATYAERLQKRGHEVFAVSRPRATPSLRERLRALLRGKKQPLGPNNSPSHFDGSPVRHRRLESFRAVTAADVPDADVCIATWWETVEWVNALPASKGVKVQFMQDYEVFGGPRERVDAVCRIPMPRICVADWVARKMREEFRLPAGDVLVIPNSVDLERFRASPRGKQAVPTVGLMYTGFRNKGTDVSIAAINLARKNVPNLRVVAFGHNEVQDRLPLPEGATYHLRAPDPQLKDIYSQADAWLFGTRIEGFGLPILEAMACRTPVIGTPAGAAPELLSRGGGILVPMEDSEAMARAIERVVAMSEPEWRDMSDNAYRTASRYTWEDATDQFEEALVRAHRGEPINGPAVTPAEAPV
jgi:glycosyltransferase involved in cell wall biosynthesis